jgi:hypothetical protein
MSEEISGRYHVRRREFLNEDPELPAFIIGVVEDTRAIPDEDDGWTNGDIVLDFADCNRRIAFYFNMHNAAERANSLRKITIIAEVVDAVRDAIALEVASRNARPVKASPVTTETEQGESVVLEVAEAEPAKTEADMREQVFTSHFVTLGL